MINQISNIKISPISAKVAEPQIAQYLFNKKAQEMAKEEITHLRASAKIEYVNAVAPASAVATDAPPATK